MSKLNQILPEPMSLIFKAKGGTDMIFKNPQKTFTIRSSIFYSSVVFCLSLFCLQ